MIKIKYYFNSADNPNYRLDFLSCAREDISDIDENNYHVGDASLFDMPAPSIAERRTFELHARTQEQIDEAREIAEAILETKLAEASK